METINEIQCAEQLVTLFQMSFKEAAKHQYQIAPTNRNQWITPEILDPIDEGKKVKNIMTIL